MRSSENVPFWAKSDVENPGWPTDKSELFHHGLHTVALKESADERGIECQAYVPALGIADPAGEEIIQFMWERLK